MRIYYWVSDYAGCAWYRAHVPGMELRKHGHEVILSHQLEPRNVEWADVIVFQRKFGRGPETALHQAKALGKTVIYELDDDLWNVHPRNPSHEHWKIPARLREVESLVRQTDVVTTTTKALASTLANLNPNTTVLPNMLPSEHWPPQRKTSVGDPLVIGWAGSMHHWPDLRLLDGIIHTILDAYPHVEFHVVGPKEIPMQRHEQARALPAVKIEDLAGLLMGFDIALAPLVDDRFNRAKSDLKLLEYGMIGLPIIASKVEPYERTMQPGVNGFLARTPKDWIRYLRRLVEDADLRDRLGTEARSLAESRTIEKNYGLWERAYQES